MGRASNRTLVLANRSVAGSGGDPNRGSFQPAFADESFDRMHNRSSDAIWTDNRSPRLHSNEHLPGEPEESI
jgi:hypothetical protein